MSRLGKLIKTDHPQEILFGPKDCCTMGRGGWTGKKTWINHAFWPHRTRQKHTQKQQPSTAFNIQKCIQCVRLAHRFSKQGELCFLVQKHTQGKKWDSKISRAEFISSTYLLPQQNVCQFCTQSLVRKHTLMTVWVRQTGKANANRSHGASCCNQQYYGHCNYLQTFILANNVISRSKIQGGVWQSLQSLRRYNDSTSVKMTLCHVEKLSYIDRGLQQHFSLELKQLWLTQNLTSMNANLEKLIFNHGRSGREITKGKSGNADSNLLTYNLEISKKILRTLPCYELRHEQWRPKPFFFTRL